MTALSDPPFDRGIVTPGSIAEARPDHPGRWIGGVVGVASCLLAIAAGMLIDGRVDLYRAADGGSNVGQVVAFVALLGVPIAFALGRQLLPNARSRGWRRAALTGLQFGVIAPVLGAFEIVAWPLIAPWDRSTGLGADGFVFLPFAIPLSFVALPITLPVGLCWAIALRAIPDLWLLRRRAPEALARLGVRHVLIAILAWMVLATVITAIDGNAGGVSLV